MNVDIAILGRPTVDQPFTEFGSQAVAFTGDRLAVTPEIPPLAAGQELQLRVTPEDDVIVSVGQRLGASAAGDVPAEPFVRGRYIAWGRKARDIPLRAGDSVMLSRHGTGVRP